MGKVQSAFLNGNAGAVSRSIDDIIISIKNAGDAAIPFGAPVFLTDSGAEPFSLTTPQDFSSFLGFAVRVADKTPESYPSGQQETVSEGAWNPGDVMEVLVRGSIVLKMASSGNTGSEVYIRKSDGCLTASAGASGTTVGLENVHLRTKRDGSGCCEVVVNERNLI